MRQDLLCFLFFLKRSNFAFILAQLGISDNQFPLKSCRDSKWGLPSLEMNFHLPDCFFYNELVNDPPSWEMWTLQVFQTTSLHSHFHQQQRRRLREYPRPSQQLHLCGAHPWARVPGWDKAHNSLSNKTPLTELGWESKIQGTNDRPWAPNSKQQHTAEGWDNILKQPENHAPLMSDLCVFQSWQPSSVAKFLANQKARKSRHNTQGTLIVAK